MKVTNVHERELRADPGRVGMLIDSLASEGDALWPAHSWPRMELDGPLGVGAAGGHGPVRYLVEEYTPNRSVRFRFTGPKGFDGFHGFEVIETLRGPAMLRHTLKMTLRGPALLSWPLLFRPLHDALIKDSLAAAQASLGEPPQVQAWSPWVKFLRRLLSAGRGRPQRRTERGR